MLTYSNINYLLKLKSIFYNQFYQDPNNTKLNSAPGHTSLTHKSSE